MQIWGLCMWLVELKRITDCLFRIGGKNIVFVIIMYIIQLTVNTSINTIFLLLKFKYEIFRWANKVHCLLVENLKRFCLYTKLDNDRLNVNDTKSMTYAHLYAMVKCRKGKSLVLHI